MDGTDWGIRSPSFVFHTQQLLFSNPALSPDASLDTMTSARNLKKNHPLIATCNFAKKTKTDGEQSTGNPRLSRVFSLSFPPEQDP